MLGLHGLHRQIPLQLRQRAPRIIRPKRWTILSLFRGFLNPLSDKQLERDETTQGIVRRLDGRGGEEQPTTA